MGFGRRRALFSPVTISAGGARVRRGFLFRFGTSPGNVLLFSGWLDERVKDAISADIEELIRAGPLSGMGFLGLVEFEAYGGTFSGEPLR